MCRVMWFDLAFWLALRTWRKMAFPFEMTCLNRTWVWWSVVVLLKSTYPWYNLQEQVLHWILFHVWCQWFAQWSGSISYQLCALCIRQLWDFLCLGSFKCGDGILEVISGFLSCCVSGWGFVLAGEAFAWTGVDPAWDYKVFSGKLEWAGTYWYRLATCCLLSQWW